MKFNHFKERFAWCFFALCATASIIAVVLICIFLVKESLPAFEHIGLFNFLGGLEWKPTAHKFGIAPMILGSIYATVGALLLAIPVGLFSAIFISRFAPRSLRAFIMPCVELLAGIPSVVYGFFGLVVIVPFIRTTFFVQGMSLLAASVILAMMILPTIIVTSVSALDAVPAQYYEGSVALGASHERAVITVVVPAARSGIITGIILALGRAIGETMAVVMVAGNQPVVPTNLLEGARTMTSNIVLEMGYAADLHRQALIATAAVLFIFILVINLIVTLIRRRAR